MATGAAGRGRSELWAVGYWELMASGVMFVIVVSGPLTAEDEEALRQAGVERASDASGEGVLHVRADDARSARMRVAAALGDRDDLDVRQG